MHNTKWSKYELNFLKENYSVNSATFCSEKLNKPIYCIYAMAHRMSLISKKRTKSALIDFQTPSNELYYTLGYLWADAHIGIKPNYVTTISIQEEDGNNIESVFNTVTKEWRVFTYKRKQKNWKNIKKFCIYNKALALFLYNELGMGNKSNEFSQKILDFIPNDKKYLFLRGLIDGDGNINSKITIYASYNYNWDVLSKYLNSINIGHKIINFKNKNGGNSSIQITTIDNMNKIVKYIYQDNTYIGLTRKFKNKYTNKYLNYLPSNRVWTEEELVILKIFFKNYGLYKCMDMLKRTKSEIEFKIKELNLKHTINKWTDKEIHFLIENKHKGVKYIAKALNRSRSSINHKIYRSLNCNND